MKNKSNTVIFFGNERIATGVSTDTPTLKALIKAGFDVCCVISNYEKGTSRNSRDLEIKNTAEENNIPIFFPDRLGDMASDIKAYGAQVGVLVAYGKIIPESIIDIFPSGIINIHPSLLPLHRGSIPIESVLLRGERRTGVSIMKLVPEMDAGPVYGYSEVGLTGSESKQHLADSLIDIGSKMIIELLPGIIDGSLVASPQDELRATYDTLLAKQDGVIDWNKPAEVIEREIRAYKDWPKSQTKIGDIEVTIHEARLAEVTGIPGNYEAAKNSLTVFCGKGGLQIISLQPSGKKEMPIQAFLAGYKI